ncbi:hypothetical protein C8F04DRAFT_1229917 [Mycena alexandri]|uniref:Uncharacterized protein n=1 Tax=Mycena alexandri TaxID=1745969 RepID=A0AAD6TB77_9AGAR|nr:hypothetical protein C8F04DRAFT_1229917 [Mycena alexandri]
MLLPPMYDADEDLKLKDTSNLYTGLKDMKTVATVLHALYGLAMCNFDEEEYMDEDVTDLVASLLLVAFDERIHFAKSCKLRSGIANLLKAQGLPHIVPLIGRTTDGRITFPKLIACEHMPKRVTGVAAFKIASLRDLEGYYYGSTEFPEIWDGFAHGLAMSVMPYSEKSDVYAFGRLMANFILFNNIRTPWQGIRVATGCHRHLSVQLF